MCEKAILNIYIWECKEAVKVQKITASNWTTDSKNQDHYTVINDVQDNLQLKKTIVYKHGVYIIISGKRASRSKFSATNPNKQ